jgi:hypothetical protein
LVHPSTSSLMPTHEQGGVAQTLTFHQRIIRHRRLKRHIDRSPFVIPSRQDKLRNGTLSVVDSLM